MGCQLQVLHSVRVWSWSRSPCCSSRTSQPVDWTAQPATRPGECCANFPHSTLSRVICVPRTAFATSNLLAFSHQQFVVEPLLAAELVVTLGKPGMHLHLQKVVRCLNGAAVRALSLLLRMLCACKMGSPKPHLDEQLKLTCAETCDGPVRTMSGPTDRQDRVSGLFIVSAARR